MKILFDHPNPFFLAHGGFQTQIEQTKQALEGGGGGLEVEYVKWWDEKQAGDIIHFFGRPTLGYVEFAQKKGIKVVIAELLTGLGSRPARARYLQKGIMSAARIVLPSPFLSRLAWDSYRQADACIALTSWEARLMREMFDAMPEKTHVVPNGVEEAFFSSKAVSRNEWLVCVATITPRKRVLELAQAALEAGTPLRIIGRPYHESDPYAQAFRRLVHEHPDLLRWEGAISDRERLACVYREARGFVLLSTMESLSLSALEAAACESPLLLADLPWARSSFTGSAQFCAVDASCAETAKLLRRFHDDAPASAPPARPARWSDVARRLNEIYTSLI